MKLLITMLADKLVSGERQELQVVLTQSTVKTAQMGKLKSLLRNPEEHSLVHMIRPTNWKSWTLKSLMRTKMGFSNSAKILSFAIFASRMQVLYSVLGC